MARAFAQKMKMDEGQARDLLAQSVAALFPQLERHFFPVPGAKEFVTWAKDHYPISLATNPVWPRPMIEHRIRWGELEPSLFQMITDADLMHACKPFPEYYLEVVKHLGLQTQDCLLVGNDPKNDLPARNVGIQVFLLAPKATQSSKTAETLAATSSKQATAWKGGFPALRKLLER